MKALLALFAKSPFGPLQAHMQKAMECVERLAPLLRAVEDGSDPQPIVEEICKLESEADEIKNEIRAHLPKSIFLPVSRRDLLEIVTLQDMIADVSQDIAVTTSFHALTFHSALHEPLAKLLEETTLVCSRVTNVSRELDELLETSFGGKEAERVLGMLEKVSVDDSIPDTAAVAAARALFSVEDELGSTNVLLWYQILRQLGRVAELAEGVGNRIRLLLAK